MIYGELVGHIKNVSEIVLRTSFDNNYRKGSDFRGVDAKRYYLLLLLLLDSKVSGDALIPLTDIIYKKESDDEGFKRILLQKIYERSLSENGSCDGLFPLVEGKGYGRLGKCYERNTNIDVNGEYSITKRGLEVLRFLHGKLDLPGELGKFDIDAAIELFSDYRRDRGNAGHRHLILSSLASIIASLPAGSFSETAVEKGRGADFVRSGGSTFDNLFIPDLSFKLGSSPYTPVMLEADMDTERLSRLADKAEVEIAYGFQNARGYQAQPAVSVYVIKGKAKEWGENGLPSENFAGGIGPEQWSLLDVPNIDSMIQLFRAACLFSRYYDGEEDLDIIDVRSTAMLDTYFAPGRMDSGFNNFVAALKEYGARTDLDYEDVTVLGERLKEDRRIYRERKKLIAAESKAFANRDLANEKRAFLYKQLVRSDRDVSFLEGGESLFILPYEELSTVMKTAFPKEAADKQVRSVLSSAGLSHDYRWYQSCRPLLYGSGNEAMVNLRNAFRSEGVTVFFEDISYDIGASVRIREYLSLPSQLVYNCLLVIIINDDLTTASGQTLDKYMYYPDPKIGWSFPGSFKAAYGLGGELPFKYRTTNDFCFIKRSDFLSCSPDSLFVMIDEDVFMTRTAAAMSEDKRAMNFRKGETYRGTVRFAAGFRVYGN